MKKTLTINLGGTVFHIDEDAYQKLNNYLTELGHHFSEEERQEMFDNKETTDDHGMVIMGKAVDQEGNRYFKVQNSWDTNQLYDGFFYCSEAYFRAKTLNILVHKDAIPAKIAKKMGIKK